MRSLICLCATLLAASLANAMPKLWEPPYVNGIAAQVGEDIITYDDIRRQLVPIAQQLGQHAPSEDAFNQEMVKATNGILRGLIERRLLINEFTRREFQVPPHRLEDEYRSILDEDFGGQLSQLVTALQAQGKTIEAFRQDLEDNMMADAMRSRFTHNLPEITPDQVQTYYNEHLNDFAQQATLELNVITVKPLADEPAEVLIQTAEALVERINKGESFEAIAEELGQTQQMSWGTLSLDELSATMRSALEKVSVGQISQPIAIDGPQVLIAKVVARQNEEVPALANIRQQIEQELRGQKAEAAYDEWIEELKEKFYVKIND